MVHITSAKGRLQRKHLVYDAPKGPNIRLVTVRLILPHLGGGVVWSASLRVVQPVLVCYLAHIHVAQFRLVKIPTFHRRRFLVLEHKDISRLDVSVHDAKFVHGPKPVDCLDQDAPHL